MKWNKKKFVEQYVAALIAQDELASKQRGLVDALAGGPTDFDGHTYLHYKFTDDLVRALIGVDNVEWVNWYLYDNIISNRGSHGGHVKINGVSHLIGTVDQLFDVCMDKTTFASVFEDNDDYRINKANLGFQMIADSLEENDFEMARLVATRINLDAKGTDHVIDHV